MRPLDQLAEIAQKAVAIGNDLIKNTRPQTVTEKSDRDTYTDVDVRIEREMRAYLAEATPEIGFMGEEEGASSQVASNEYFWALDPIDGTSNYVHGVPLYAVSLALIHQDSAIVAAISLPVMDLRYTAVSGRGAFLNGSQIHVSTISKLSKAIISLGDYAIGHDATRKNQRRIALTAALADRVERIRMFGSAAHDLVWVAEGRIDAAVILSNNFLDMAAGVLIAREAGAKITSSSGDRHTFSSSDTIAAAPSLSTELMHVVRTVDGQRSIDDTCP